MFYHSAINAENSPAGEFFFSTQIPYTQDELQKLAKNYYVEYLYPRLLGDIGVEPGKMLAEYKEKGVATTYLRQLLHYNHDENIEMAPLFQDAGCDTNTTSVRYYPTEPYGPKNYTVEYNFRCRIGEIDLIARDGEYLVFCEVKYRAGAAKGHPAEAVGIRKQRVISKCAAYYLTTRHLPGISCRFDVVSVEGNEITLIKNAFDYAGR